MKLIILASEWNSNIPKNVLIFIIGVVILGVGILWKILRQNHENKKDITRIESKSEKIYRIEDGIDIWGLIVTGIALIIWSLFM